MKRQNAGSKELPDFKELNDRIIAQASDEPTLVIKTNLDTDNVLEENPYFHEETVNKEKFISFFKEKE